MAADNFGASVVHACWLAGFSRTAWYRASRAVDQMTLRMRIRELAFTRPRFGVNRIYVLLRREGWRVNRKRVRRLYRPRRAAGAHAGETPQAQGVASRTRASAERPRAAVEHVFRP